MRNGKLATALIGLILTACTSSPSASTRSETAQVDATQAAPSRALVMLVRYEPPTLAVKPLRDAGAGVNSTTRLFNATLDLEDGEGKHHPYLAEAIPELNSDSWRVSPDGTMETRYRLKPNLTWQDGEPLTADDFAFAWQVYASPTVGAKGLRPLNMFASVDAEDDRTVVIHWLAPYPLASALGTDFQPFPRHILAKPFAEDDPEAFLAEPFWTTEYIGLGPYLMERWEPGASIDGVAFDGHVLGRPKIGHIVVKFVADENTALTHLLAGDGDYATGRSLRYEHATVLMQEWDPPAKGTVLLTPDTTRFTAVQFRPDLVSPQAVLDVRVRQAIVHSIDLDALNDGIFGGKGAMGGSLVILHSHFDRFQDQEKAVREIDKAVTNYPFDLHRAESLLTEAGFHRGNDGVQVSASGERLSMDVWADAGPQYEKEQAILGDTWQQVGIETQTTFVPPARLRDGQYRSSFPSLHTTSVGRLESLVSTAIPTAEHRWSGSNRGSWTNPDYDRLWGLLNTTLDPDERVRQVAAMMKLVSDELPLWMLYSNPSVSAYATALSGPDNASQNSDVWNVYDWKLR